MFYFDILLKSTSFSQLPILTGAYHPPLFNRHGGEIWRDGGDMMTEGLMQWQGAENGVCSGTPPFL